MRHRLEQFRPLVTASYLEAKVKADIPGAGPPRLSCPHSLPYSVAVSTGSTTAVGCAVPAALVPGTQLMSHPPVSHSWALQDRALPSPWYLLHPNVFVQFYVRSVSSVDSVSPGVTFWLPVFVDVLAE